MSKVKLVEKGLHRLSNFRNGGHHIARADRAGDGAGRTDIHLLHSFNYADGLGPEELVQGTDGTSTGQRGAAGPITPAISAAALSLQSPRAAR